MKKVLLIFLVSAFMLTKSYAQLFTFNFTGPGTCPTQNDTVIQPANVKVTGLYRYGSLTCTATNDYFNTATWSQSASRDTTQFIELVVTADSSTKLTLSAITFLTMKSSTGPDTILITHNASGTFNAVSPKMNPSGTTNNQISWTFPTVTTAFGASVRFRIYGWKAAGSTGTLRITNLSVYGNTVTNSPLSYDYMKGYVGVGLPGSSLPTQRLQVNGNLLLSNGRLMIGAMGGTIDTASMNTNNYSLGVNGTAIVNKLVVKKGSSPWPDYVFSRSYQLIPLDSLGMYIDKYKHLPEIPSAAAAGQAGLDIYETQAALLREVEKLTLYILEQDRRQKRQDAEIRRLTKTVTNLEKRVRMH